MYETLGCLPCLAAYLIMNSKLLPFINGAMDMRPTLGFGLGQSVLYNSHMGLARGSTPPG